MCLYYVAYAFIYLHMVLNGAVKAVMAEGKEHALAVGVTKMSTTKMFVVFLILCSSVYMFNCLCHEKIVSYRYIYIQITLSLFL